MKIQALVIASCMIMGVSSYTQAAGSSSGKLEVKVKIEAGCKIINAGPGGSASQFGILDFGTHSSLASALDSKAVSPLSGSVDVSCTNGTNYTVTLDGGANSSGGQRRMKNGSEYIAYNLFQDNARSTPWVAAAPANYTSTGTSQALNFYGRIPTNATTPSPGTYTDSVTVTVAW